jgi:hypothetical protein
MTIVQRRKLIAYSVGQCFCSTQVRKKVPVSFEDVELIRGCLLVVPAVGPRACGRGSVLGGELKGADCDAEVEVAEDQLNPTVVSRGRAEAVL